MTLKPRSKSMNNSEDMTIETLTIEFPWSDAIHQPYADQPHTQIWLNQLLRLTQPRLPHSRHSISSRRTRHPRGRAKIQTAPAQSPRKEEEGKKNATRVELYRAAAVGWLRNGSLLPYDILSDVKLHATTAWNVCNEVNLRPSWLGACKMAWIYLTTPGRVPINYELPCNACLRLQKCHTSCLLAVQVQNNYKLLAQRVVECVKTSNSPFNACLSRQWQYTTCMNSVGVCNAVKLTTGMNATLGLTLNWTEMFQWIPNYARITRYGPRQPYTIVCWTVCNDSVLATAVQQLLKIH